MPADVALLVEVSEATLAQDRGPKRTAYAQAGIAVYWIINLVARQVEVYTRPVKEGRYRSRKVYRAGQQVPAVIAGRTFPRSPLMTSCLDGRRHDDGDAAFFEIDPYFYKPAGAPDNDCDFHRW